MYLFDPSRVACGGTAGCGVWKGVEKGVDGMGRGVERGKKQPPQLLKLRRLNKHIE